ncbi:MAG: cysteine synthase A [Vibrionaceae bacterium]
MKKIHQDNSTTIGNTPLVRLQRVGPSNIFLKIESRNPSFSVKCRVGASMIWDAEERGLLKPGVEIIEPTSGNTGIALAYVAAARGYQLTLTMPTSMSTERRKLLQALGAQLILTPADKGMQGAIDKANEIVNSDPQRYLMLQQFDNPANPAIHEQTTGPEIWNDMDGNIDVLVAGVGTGGTITGISRYIKHTQGKAITTVAVEPEESPIIQQTLAGLPLTPGAHKIQGIGPGFIPKNLDLSLIDEVVTVNSEEAMLMTRKLIRREGILGGISSGAAVEAACQLAARPEYADKNIVVILPSASERYLSTALFSDLFTMLEAVQ